MRSRKSRTVLSLLLAGVFAIAAMPGSMAMPAPQPAMPAMAGMEHCAGMAADTSNPCDQSHHDQGVPCKNMAACLGMLSCFGMGAVDVSSVAAPPAFAEPAVAIAHQTVSGLTLQPDNPPPIA